MSGFLERLWPDARLDRTQRPVLILSVMAGTLGSALISVAFQTWDAPLFLAGSILAFMATWVIGAFLKPGPLLWSARNLWALLVIAPIYSGYRTLVQSPSEPAGKWIGYAFFFLVLIGNIMAATRLWHSATTSDRAEAPRQA